MWLKKINIYLIISLAFIVRLVSLNQSLWWDEAINVVYAKQNDFWWFIIKYPLGDFHPPGWFAILWVWGNLFGWSEISVRMPSVFLGVATVFLTYSIGKELFSRKVGLVSSLMLSIAPLHIYYSQEARMYSLSAFAVSFSIYSLILVINKKKLGMLLFIFSTILVLSSDYVAYFIFAMQFIYLLFFEKKMIKTYLFLFITSLIIFSPWLYLFPQQLISGQKTALSIPGWGEVVGGNSIKELIILPIKIMVGRISFDNSFLYYGLIAIVAVPYLLIFSKIKEIFNRKNYLILLWLFITPILVWFFSYFIPVFSYFRLLYILPVFYIVLSICLEKFSSKLFSILILSVIVFELLASCLYLSNNNFQREDWREAINFVLQNQNDKNLIVFENPEIPAPVKYYSNNLSDFQPGLSDNFEKSLVNKKKVFLFEYLAGVYDPRNIVKKKLSGLNYINTQIYNFRGVGFVRLYIKM